MIKALLCKLVLSCAVAGPNAKPVDDLAYGEVLYNYFQQDYNAALVTTLVAEEQGRTGEDALRFKLAKGSFAFSDGMYRYADSVFAAIDPAELSELDNLRLAFHLSRDYHRRGDWAGLAEQLAKIELGKSWLGRAKFHPEVEFMRSELLVQQGQFDQAQQVLAKLDDKQPLRAYGLYNLAVALRTTEPDAARGVFAELSQMPAYSDEAFDLIQRAKLARAFLAREQSERADAEAVLKELPGTGRYRDTALAAYASLAMDSGDHELAARIWMTLQQENYWTPSTAAARLGFPLSLEHLSSSELALEQYRVAEQSFAARLTALDSLTTKAEDPDWIQGLLHTFSTPEVEDSVSVRNNDADASAKRPSKRRFWWGRKKAVAAELAEATAQERAMGEVMRNWQEELGHTDWLEWLSSESVHDVLLQWRHLQGEREWLQALPNRLEAYEQVAVEQKRRSGVANETLYTNGLVENREALSAQADTLANTIQRLQQQTPSQDLEWLLSLASAEERKRLLKLQAMADKLQRYAQNPATANNAKMRDWQPWLSRIDRLRGLTFWEIANSKAQRVRELQKSLGQIEALQQDLDQRIARVQGAQEQFVTGVEADYLAFADRATQLQAQVAQAIEQREYVLAQEIRKGMRQEQQQVKKYLLATRVAIARASDQLAGVNPNLLPNASAGVQQ